MMATEKRLIDARYLTSQMYLICEACQTENIFIDSIIDEIDNAPDVDAVEVAHGHNTYDHNSAFGCSVCGFEDWDTHTADIQKYNYCPNCGAKMDGERK